jgi:hypothetical protein
LRCRTNIAARAEPSRKNPELANLPSSVPDAGSDGTVFAMAMNEALMHNDSTERRAGSDPVDPPGA